MFIWRVSNSDDDFVSIPNMSWFEINGYGVVRERGNKKVIPHFHGNITLMGKTFYVPALICLAHKNILIDIQHTSNIEVMYVDGDPTNWSADNLVYRFVEPLIPKRYPKHRVIPGYTRYAISRKGEVIELRTGRVCTPYFAEDMYVTVYLKHDCKPEGANRLLHRVWALAWLKYSADVDRMHVNHVNTNRHDFSENNLEWTTHSGNLLHAVENGLYSTAKPIEIWDVEQNTFTTYPSILSASRATGITNTKLKRGVVHGMLFDDRWVCRYAGDDMPWPELDNLDVKVITNAKRPVIVVHSDGTEVEVESQAAAAKLANMSLASVQERIVKFPGKLGRKGFGFKYP